MEGVELDQRGSIAQLVNTYGGSASIALLDPRCSLFTLPTVEGVIGYKEGPGCRVVFGDPVCSFDDLSSLCGAFHADAGRKSIIYVTASPEFSSWALQNVCKGKIETEEELILNPQNDPTLGSDAHQLRKKLNRAKDGGIEVVEFKGGDVPLEIAIRQVGLNWLKGRVGPQIYMAKIDLDFDSNGKRWFYAKVGERMYGLLILQRLDAKGGWLIHMVMAEPDAPQGTSESLVVHVLRQLNSEGCTYVTFGATPRDEVGEVEGLKPFSAYVGRKGFNFSKRFFDLDNRRKYWKKYKPDSEKCYILFSKDRIGLREVVGILRAFNVSV